MLNRDLVTFARYFVNRKPLFYLRRIFRIQKASTCFDKLVKTKFSNVRMQVNYEAFRTSKQQNVVIFSPMNHQQRIKLNKFCVSVNLKRNKVMTNAGQKQ